MTTMTEPATPSMDDLVREVEDIYFPAFKDDQEKELIPLTELPIVRVQKQTEDPLAECQIPEPPIEQDIKQTESPFAECPITESPIVKISKEKQGRLAEFPTAEEKEELEKKLDDALKEGDLNSIEEELTVKTLTSCTTNALFKAFEVNKRLINLAKAGGPEKEEFQALANSVDEFTSALINPLKAANKDTRKTFGRCLDYVVDKAIDAEQKKFISYPVVYNLLRWRWYGSFLSKGKSPWSKPGRWVFLLLNLWTLIDVFVFPILFVLFFIVHMFRVCLQKCKATEMGFVVSLSKEADLTEEAFTLIKNTISNVCIHKYGCQSAKYRVIQRDSNEIIKVDFDDEYSFLVKLKAMEKDQHTHDQPRLHEDLRQARDSFHGLRTKKILLVFVNDEIDTLGSWNEELKTVVSDIKKLGIKLMPVGIGEHARLEELREIASKKISPLQFGGYESPRTLAKAILQGIEGKDIYEHYLNYFTTPYFIFVRDTLSYVFLLGLHFAICLSPSTVAFSGLEWAIFVFFLGRIVMEVDQFVNANKTERKPIRPKCIRGSNYQICSQSELRETQPEESVVMRKCCSYFSDRWNWLDFIILLIYVITFTLRMITWGVTTEVYDNRPLAVACCLYGLIAMFLTLRVFGHVMEYRRDMGTIQIALFFIMGEVSTIFWQFLATMVAFSLVMTKIYVAEKSYISNRNAGEELYQVATLLTDLHSFLTMLVRRACSSGGVDCWWSMSKHLAWSLLGMAELDQLDSIDVPSVTLARFLYSFFLIMGVILLVNMMIALLSNTYQRVEDNSLREWSFKKAITMKTYNVYHPIPVPFNLLSIPVAALRQLCQGCFSKGRPIDKAGINERERNLALDKLVVKLQKEYLATYGYSFPLTDERKMDQLLHETEGNRQMTNQIVQRVFRQRDHRQRKYRTDTCMEESWYSHGIRIEGCLLTCEGANFCDDCKESKRKEHHGARHLAPFTREMPRIEVLIQEIGENRMLAVGVVYDTCECHAMPGWWGGTVGYHVDDGKIFEDECAESGKLVEDAMAYRGDLVACHVNFDDVIDGRIPVVFFLNGRKVDRATMRYTAGRTSLFPFIGMGDEGIRVLAKMCPHDTSPAPSSCSSSEIPAEEKTFESDLVTIQDMWRSTRKELEAVRQQIEQKMAKQEEMIAELRSLLLNLSREVKKEN